MTYTADWTPATLNELAAQIGATVAAWNAQPGPVPAAGEHDAEAARAGHAAVKAIDDLVRHVHVLREHLVTEMGADEDGHMGRAGELLAERGASGGGCSL